jgi:hypothetical protein
VGDGWCLLLLHLPFLKPKPYYYYFLYIPVFLFTYSFSHIPFPVFLAQPQSMHVLACLPPLFLQTPLIMTAIQTSTGSLFIGPGIWMTGMSLVTVVSSLALLKWYPQTNKF